MGISRSPRRCLAVLVPASYLLAGCVYYAPVGLAGVRPEEELRVRLTNPAAVRVAPSFGRIRGELSGAVEARGGDSLQVSVWLGKDYQGTPFENAHQVVILSRDEVTELSRREVSMWRTAVVAVGAAAAFSVLVDRLVFWGNPNPTDEDGTTTPPPAFRPLSAMRIVLKAALHRGSWP